MIRAWAKGSLLFAFGRVPGGPWMYRALTRGALGTQATHVDKLNRVWPGYVKVWREEGGFDLEGRDVAIYEGGWTPFPFLLAYLLTGKGGVVFNAEGRMHPRYIGKAIAAARQVEFEGVLIPDERRARLDSLRDANLGLGGLLEAVGGKLEEGVRPDRLPSGDATFDLLHSGGTLEHLHPAELDAFLAETYRLLRPGGLSSHVFDLRDHLYHADKRYPFLNHLRFSEPSYRLWFGHRLLYHSRLSVDSIRARFASAGFEEVGVRRLVLPKGGYAASDEEVLAAKSGLPRERLAPGHRDKSDLDLRTAAAHFLLRKPGGTLPAHESQGTQQDGRQE